MKPFSGNGRLFKSDAMYNITLEFPVLQDDQVFGLHKMLVFIVAVNFIQITYVFSHAGVHQNIMTLFILLLNCVAHCVCFAQFLFCNRNHQQFYLTQNFYLDSTCFLNSFQTTYLDVEVNIKHEIVNIFLHVTQCVAQCESDRFFQDFDSDIFSEHWLFLFQFF